MTKQIIVATTAAILAGVVMRILFKPRLPMTQIAQQTEYWV